MGWQKSMKWASISDRQFCLRVVRSMRRLGCQNVGAGGEDAISYEDDSISRMHGEARRSPAMQKQHDTYCGVIDLHQGDV